MFETVGWFVAVVVFVRIAMWAREAFFSEGPKLTSYGAWAVVTGATDGIGKAIAAELVKKGMKVLIIGRSQERLKETEKAISTGKGEVETLCVDFENFGSPQTEGYSQVAKALAGKDIGLLVNNVGISYEFPMYFHEVDDARVNSLLKLNIESVVYMSRAVLPGMVERKRGAILNISSASGVIPAPLLTLYGASKSFVDKFSRDLDSEYASQGICVQSQAPLWIATKLASVRREKASLATPLPEVYAKSALRRIGGNSASNAGYWVHDVANTVISELERLPFVRMAIDTGIKNMHKGIRKAGLKKREKKAAETKTN